MSYFWLGEKADNPQDPAEQRCFYLRDHLKQVEDRLSGCRSSSTDVSAAYHVSRAGIAIDDGMRATGAIWPSHAA